MKRFKLWLVWLLLGLFWFTCFSSANFVNYWQYVIDYSVDQYPFWLSDDNINFQQDWLLCVDYFLDDPVPNSMWLTISQSNWSHNVDEIISNGMWIYCAQLSSEWSKWWTVWIELREEVNWYAWLYFFPSWWGWWSCPEIDTWSILSGSCDTNYCVENDLCPVPSNFSTLYINDIEHQSAPIINVTIPYEYSWDSSVDSWQFDLVISWQNVDYEYIDWIIRAQKSTPNNTDFNNIVSGLIPLLIPWLVIILFLRFIFRFIKKIF